MRAFPPLPLVLLLAAALAGCNAPAPPAQPEPTPSWTPQDIPMDVIEVDHDHTNPAEHAVEYNLMQMGYHSGYGDGNASAVPGGQGFSELFVRDGLAFLGRRGGADGGFLIFDVHDAMHPKLLGAYPGLANYDMESTSDNKYVFFVSQYLNNQQPSSIPPDDSGEAPRGIHVVDITNRANPARVAYLPVPTRGVHTITYHRTDDGRELVAAQTYDFLPDPSLGLPVPGQGPNPVAQRVVLFEFVRAPQPHLEPRSTFEQRDPTAVPLNSWFPHDVAIQKHPKTGRLIMYVAYWDLGAILVDITDPSNPVEISRLTDFSPSKLAMVHLAAPADTLIAGRHVTVTEPELGGGEKETGQYTLFDTTDPTQPKRLGFWSLPGNITNDEGLRFSPHNFEVENGRLILAHYHGGIWVVDVGSEERLREPRSIGFALPHENRTSAKPEADPDAPMVWTALSDGGLIYASDMVSGLYVYHYAGDPMPRMMDGMASHQHD